MSEVHGSGVFVSVGGTDISAFVNDSPLNEGADVHDKTTYGNVAKRRKGGLQDNTYKLTGVYDDGSTTPQTIFQGNAGDSFAIIDRPEGTGSGKPQAAFTAVLKLYTTTKPYNDIIRWSADFDVDGAVTWTTQ